MSLELLMTFRTEQHESENLGDVNFAPFNNRGGGAKGGKMRKYEEAIKDILGGFREAKNDTWKFEQESAGAK